MTLKQKTITGVAWNGAGNIARQVLQVVTLVVMARFLSPDDFGIFAILMIFVTFMNIFGTMGTAQVIIHLDKPDQRMLSSIFFFNIAAGIFLFGILFLLAKPVAIFFDNSELIHLLQIVGLSFIITSLTLVQRALLEKSLNFKRVVTLETISLTIASFAGILAAIKSFGIYSLIIMSLSNPIILSLGLWINSHWRPTFEFSFTDIKRIWSYSFNLMNFNVINYFSRHADNFLIGKFIGSSSLGLYSVAYKIMLYPLDNISRVIIRVLFPAFSQIKHDNIRFKNSYLKAISFIALVTFPVMAGLLAISETLVPVLFGDKWLGMAKLLMIMAPIGMVQSIVTTVGSIYTAKGTTALMFKIGGVNSVVTVLSFIIGLPFGVEGVAIAYAIANLIMLYPNLKISWDQINLGVLEGMRQLMPFFISAAIMSASVYMAGLWLVSQNLASIAILPLQVASGALIYSSILLIFSKTKVVNLIKELKTKKQLSSTPVEIL
jgi:O-antigen/teichoic acid export membrane protein